MPQHDIVAQPGFLAWIADILSKEAPDRQALCEQLEANLACSIKVLGMWKGC